jgi:hypothetical protein
LVCNGKDFVISKLAHCSAGDDQTVDKYLPRQLGKKTTVVHLALLAAGNCEPHGRLPLVQLTVLPQTDYFPVVAIVLGVYRDGVSTFNDREKAVEGTRSSKDYGLDTAYSPSVSIVLFPHFCLLREESFLVGRIVAKGRDPQLTEKCVSPSSARTAATGGKARDIRVGNFIG